MKMANQASVEASLSEPSSVSVAWEHVAINQTAATIARRMDAALASDSPQDMRHCNHCLLIEEILQFIFSNLHRGDLAVAALVCKAWLDPALGALWEEVDLVWLLDVLSPTYHNDRKLHFALPLSEATWTRFHNLAPRIRALNNYRDVLSNELIDEFSLTNPRPFPSLPNIRMLRWYGVEPTPSVAFMGPGLRHFDIEIPGHPDPVFFTRAASALGGNLTSIKIYYYFRYPAVQLDVEQLARMLRSLSGLLTANISIYADLGAVVTALSELPALMEAVIFCTTISIPATSLLIHKPFPSIRRLELQARESINGILALFDRMADRSCLTNVVLGNLSRSCRLQDVGEAVKSLAGHRDWRNIGGTADRRPASITSGLLGPMGVCSSIEVLKVYVEGSLILSDRELEFLLPSLPRLHELALWGDVDAPTTLTTLTINSLGIVVASCPLIADIYFSTMDVSGQTIQHPPCPSSNLHTIHVGKSVIRIEDARAVAILFVSLSDNVGGLAVTSEWHRGTEQGELWNEVQELIPTLKRTREKVRQMVEAPHRA